jgi:hypothetical protein
MKFTIKSEKLEHKDQIIELYFSDMKFVNDLSFYPISDDSYNRYEGKSVWGEYLGSSRIDGYPIFRIDTTSLDREEKISQILK